MKDMVLGAQKQYKEQNNGYMMNGLMAVLKFWDDPDRMFDNYLRKEKKMITFPGNESKRNSIAKKGGSTSESYALALIPVIENTANKRAMKEIKTIL